MAKTAQIKKFKIAFLKPQAPSKELVTLKTKIEKQMKTASKKLSADQREAEGKVEQLLKQVHKQDPQYCQKLVNYKLTKHWDEPSEFAVWARKAPNQKDVVDFLDGMMGDSPSEDLISSVFSHAPTTDAITSKCWNLAPDRLVQDGVAFVEKHHSAHPCDQPAFQSKVALEIFKKGKHDDVVSILGRHIQPEDVREMAKLDPARFAKVVVEKANNTSKMNLLQDPEVRAALATDEELWEKLSESVPMLPFFDAVQTRVESKKPSKNKLNEVMAEAVFDELLKDGNALGMTYYTNTFTSPSLMLAGSPKEIKQRIDQNRQGPDKDKMPDQPAAQCDELVTVLKYVMEGALGAESGVNCKHIVIPGMVLTVPIDTLPGGLLKNTFGGNVFGDAGLNKQVLFSGNDFGDAPNAHTYLDVGGVLYDAVLGTKGKAVTDAVAEEFGPWNKTGYESVAYPGTPIWVAKSKTSGNYVLKETDDKGRLESAPNRCGFGTAYRLTANLDRYATVAKKPEATEEDKSEEATSEKVD
jgi:hypothetical protein